MLWFWLQCDYWEVFSFMMQSSPSSYSNSNVTALMYAAACVALRATIPLSWCVTQLAAIRADPAWWCQHAPSNPWQCECPLLCIKQRNESCRTGKLGKKTKKTHLLLSEQKWEPTFRERRRGRSLCESAMFTRKIHGTASSLVLIKGDNLIFFFPKCWN